MLRCKIADSTDKLTFNNNGICIVSVNDTSVCIGKYEDKLFAFPRKCPHAGADMSLGYIDRLGNVVCPLHHYRFSLSNGRNVSGEGYFLKRYAVEVDDDGVFVLI